MSIPFLLMAVFSLQGVHGFTPRSAVAPRARRFATLFAVSKQQKLTEIPSRGHSTVTKKEMLHREKPPLHNFPNLLEAADSKEPVPTSSWKQNMDLSDPQTAFALIAGILAFTTVVAVTETVGWDVITQSISHLLSDPKQFLQEVIGYVETAGPMAPLIFGIFYMMAEILAVPATPLTLSAGYLFGFQTGFAIVLVAATLAASAAFFIGKTFLRQWVEQILAENAKLAKIDKAIGREGFRLLLLVRLSPLFPFALSNYVYGASSIEFAPYFFGTLLGFAPGTMGMVYAGMVGKALTTGDGTQPWYVYAGGSVVLGVFLKLVADVAGNIINSMEEDDDDDTAEVGKP